MQLTIVLYRVYRDSELGADIWGPEDLPGADTPGAWLATVIPARVSVFFLTSLQLFSPCISAHTVWGPCWYNPEKRSLSDSMPGTLQVRSPDLSVQT